MSRGHSGSRKVLVSDPEFEAKVRARMSSEDDPLVSKDKAQNIGGDDRFNIWGVNLRDNYTENSPGVDDRIEQRFWDALTPQERKAKVLRNRARYVVGVGANATPGTFAHEYRHDRIEDEFTNRLEDVLQAASPEDYASAEMMLFNMLDQVPADKQEFLIRQLRGHISNQRWHGSKLPNINPERQIQINQAPPKTEEPGLASSIRKALGMELKYTSSGRELNPTDLEERVAYPGLNFIGLGGMTTGK